MAGITYDDQTDAVYIALGHGAVARTRKNGAFAYDLDAGGQMVGIEIQSASKVLAPGDWKKVRRRRENQRQPGRTAHLHRGFLFIRSSQRDAEPQTES
jgi:uncharacterized protein YuzE